MKTIIQNLLGITELKNRVIELEKQNLYLKETLDDAADYISELPDSYAISLAVDFANSPRLSKK